MQCATKVMSYSQGLVEFPVGLVDSLGNLSEEQVKFLRKMFLRNFKVSSPVRTTPKPVHLRNLQTHQSLVILYLCLSKICSGEYHDNLL